MTRDELRSSMTGQERSESTMVLEAVEQKIRDAALEEAAKVADGWRRIIIADKIGHITVEGICLELARKIRALQSTARKTAGE